MLGVPFVAKPQVIVSEFWFMSFCLRCPVCMSFKSCLILAPVYVY